MELTVLNRLTLLGMLPPGGDLTLMRLIRDLVGVLSFSQEEHDLLKFWVEGEPGKQRQRWDDKADEKVRKDCHISKRMQVFFVDKLREAAEAEELTLAQLELWEKLDCDNFDSPAK